MSYTGEKTTDQRPFTNTQTILGSGTWDGTSGLVLVSGDGERTIHLASAKKTPTFLLIVDLDGTAEEGNITLVGGGSTINGLDSAAIQANFGSLCLVTNDVGESGSWITVSQTPGAVDSGNFVSRGGGSTPEPPVLIEEPIISSSGKSSVISEVRGPNYNTFSVFSVNAALVATHQYGPTASAGTALNLSYRASAVTTVAGFGVVNATDNTRVLSQGMGSRGSTFIYRGTNSLSSTVFAVDDMGGTTVGPARSGAHAVNRDYVTWVESRSNKDTTLTSLGPGRTNLHLADGSQGPHTVFLGSSPSKGDRVIVKDHAGVAPSVPLIVDGNGYFIDGLTSQGILEKYGALSLYFDGLNWVVA